MSQRNVCYIVFSSRHRIAAEKEIVRDVTEKRLLHRVFIATQSPCRRARTKVPCVSYSGDNFASMFSVFNMWLFSEVPNSRSFDEFSERLQIVLFTLEDLELNAVYDAYHTDVDLDAKIKFFVAETLRGVGGLVFVAHGNHCANELGRRNYVTGEMWKNKPPFRLAVNKATSDEIATDTASMPQSDEILRIRSRPCPEHVSKMEDLIEAHCQIP